MGLRIKEVCKEKKITMAQIAEKLGINPITLSQSLNGNPTLGRLQEVAEILGVDVSELFEQKEKDVYGCLVLKGTPVMVNGKEDLEAVLNQL